MHFSGENHGAARNKHTKSGCTLWERQPKSTCTNTDGCIVHSRLEKLFCDCVRSQTLPDLGWVNSCNDRYLTKVYRKDYDVHDVVSWWLLRKLSPDLNQRLPYSLRSLFSVIISSVMLRFSSLVLPQRVRQNPIMRIDPTYAHAYMHLLTLSSSTGGSTTSSTPYAEIFWESSLVLQGYESTWL